MGLRDNKTVGNQVLAISLFSVTILVFAHLVNGYIDINQYCKAFDENFRPIICIIKNSTKVPHPPPPNHNPPPPPPPRPTQFPILLPHPGHHHPPPPSHHPTPHPPDYTDYEDDNDCSCEITCTPIIINQRSFSKHKSKKKKRYKRTPSTGYRCSTCGAECPVSTSRSPTCNCAVPSTRAECNCTATCATFHSEPLDVQAENDDDDDDENDDDKEDNAQCILSVTALEDWRIGEERPPYLCECERSKEAETTTKPDFVCICQRITRD